MEASQKILPVQVRERVQVLDIIRGIVLCGILLMNINGMGLANAYGDPTIAGGFEGWNKTTWTITNLFFEGTMRALFSLLFGVGMFMLLDRMQKSNLGIKAADIYFRRLTWLLLFGILHAYFLIWSGEILFNYALMGFIVYSFRNLNPKKLILSATVLVLLGVTWNFLEYKGQATMLEHVALAKEAESQNKPVDKEWKGSLKAWEAIQEERSPEFIMDYNESMRQGYWDVFSFHIPIVMKWKTYMPYRYDPWDVLPMMLLGIALFKLGIVTGQRPVRFYLFMLLLGYGIGLPVNYLETQNILDQQFAHLSFYESSITYDLGRIPTAMGHLSLIILLCKVPWLSWFFRPLGAMGRMALTNYLMHSLFSVIIFTGVGFSLFGTLERYELLFIVFGIWIFQYIMSPIWLKFFHYGPVEWLWRRLSYLEIPAFKKMP